MISQILLKKIMYLLKFRIFRNILIFYHIFSGIFYRKVIRYECAHCLIMSSVTVIKVLHEIHEKHKDNVSQTFFSSRKI